MFANKEFVMTDADFEFVRDTVYKTCGIVLGEHKKQMVYSRLARRIRALGLSSHREYINYLESHKEKEFSEFINALTTNLTSFFREQHHFDFLKSTVIPELCQIHQRDRRIRFWSAGCSSGEEPYSIMMTMMSNMSLTNWDFKLLATDLDSNVLSRAAGGVYGEHHLEGVQTLIKDRYFDRIDAEDYQVKPELKQFISFKRLNLLQPKWPMKGPFDVIFCRNVLIYFDQETKDTLFKRYADMLRPGGYLFIGHSESVGKGHPYLRPLGKTMYQCEKEL